MNKQEFLQALRRDLSGDVPPDVVEENMRYYDEYISGEVGKGRTEEEVIEEIGTPRLIAKNIEDTTDMPDEDAGNGYYENSGYGSAGDAYGDGSYGSTGYGSTGGNGYDSRRQEPRGSFHVFDLSKWYVKLAIIVIVFLVLYAVFVIVGGIFTLLAPVLGPIIIVLLLIRLFQGPRQRW